MLWRRIQQHTFCMPWPDLSRDRPRHRRSRRTRWIPCPSMCPCCTLGTLSPGSCRDRTHRQRTVCRTWHQMPSSRQVCMLCTVSLRSSPCRQCQPCIGCSSFCLCQRRFQPDRPCRESRGCRLCQLCRQHIRCIWLILLERRCQLCTYSCRRRKVWQGFCRGQCTRPGTWCTFCYPEQRIYQQGKPCIPCRGLSRDRPFQLCSTCSW